MSHTYDSNDGVVMVDDPVPAPPPNNYYRRRHSTKGKVMPLHIFAVWYLGSRRQLADATRVRSLTPYTKRKEHWLTGASSAMTTLQTPMAQPQTAAKFTALAKFGGVDNPPELIKNECYVAVWHPFKHTAYIYRVLREWMPKSSFSPHPAYVLKVTNFETRKYITTSGDFDVMCHEIITPSLSIIAEDVAAAQHVPPDIIAPPNSISSLGGMKHKRMRETQDRRHRHGGSGGGRRRHDRHYRANHSDDDDSHFSSSPSSMQDPSSLSHSNSSDEGGGNRSDYSSHSIRDIARAFNKHTRL